MNIEKDSLNTGDFDLFIFDWDGTLAIEPIWRKLNKKLNPLWRIRKAKARRLTASEAIAEEPKEVERHIYKKGAYESIMRTKTSFEVRSSDLLLLLLEPRLRAGAKQALSKLSRRGKLVTLVTDGVFYRVYREVEKLGMLEYFEAMLSLQAINRLKPDPLGAELMLKTLNVKKSRAVYIGDMADDILFAKYAGIKSCAVAGGFDSYEYLEMHKPDFIFRSMKEFEEHIR